MKTYATLCISYEEYGEETVKGWFGRLKKKQTVKVTRRFFRKDCEISPHIDHFEVSPLFGLRCPIYDKVGHPDGSTEFWLGNSMYYDENMTYRHPDKERSDKMVKELLDRGFVQT